MQINNLIIGGNQIDQDVYKQAARKLANGEGTESTIARLATQGITDAKVDGEVIVIDEIVIAGNIQGTTLKTLQNKYKGVFADTITGGISFD